MPRLSIYKKGAMLMDKRYMAIGTSMLVLKLLEEEPLYGYQMILSLIHI